MNKSSSCTPFEKCYQKKRVFVSRVAIVWESGACSLKSSTVAGSSFLRGPVSTEHTLDI